MSLPLQGRTTVIPPPPPDIHKRGPMLARIVERDAEIQTAWGCKLSFSLDCHVPSARRYIIVDLSPDLFPQPFKYFELWLADILFEI